MNLPLECARIFSLCSWKNNNFADIYSIFFLLFVDKLQAEERKRQKAIDDWLPITSSRNAKWYYSAFHKITVMIGAGVLGFPYAMSELGWYVFLNFTNYKVVLLF